METATASKIPVTNAHVTGEIPITTTATTTTGANNRNETTGDWVHFDNSMDDASSNAKEYDKVMQNGGENLCVSHQKNNIEIPDSSSTTATTTTVPAPPMAITTTTSSSTAYSFIGSALGSGSIANLNEPATADAAAACTSSSKIGIGSGSGAEKKMETPTTASSSSADKDEQDANKNDDSIYECNICLDTAKDAVVSLCGHLFCWPCLHQWLETRPNRKLCPVCKAAVDKDKVIPLYGRNSVNQEDPRNKVPPRPAGQRTEPEPQGGFPGFGFGDGFHMSFGIGAFPFGFFTSSLNIGEARPAAANRGTTQFDDEQTLSKLFLYLAFMCIAWLLFA